MDKDINKDKGDFNSSEEDVNSEIEENFKEIIEKKKDQNNALRKLLEELNKSRPNIKESESDK